MVIEKCHLHFLDNLLVAYPYTNQCILIARIITVVLRKYYTKTLIILRRQSYFKNVSRRGARASGIQEGSWGSSVDKDSRGSRIDAGNRDR
jgi:hypothetical protein